MPTSVIDAVREEVLQMRLAEIRSTLLVCARNGVLPVSSAIADFLHTELTEKTVKRALRKLRLGKYILYSVSIVSTISGRPSPHLFTKLQEEAMILEATRTGRLRIGSA